MKKIILFQLIVTLGFTSCINTKKEIDQLEIAKQYYIALDHSDGLLMKKLLRDSLHTVETDYNYKQTFSKKEYVEKWLKWDSVFDPTYKVLNIEKENEIVKATISKIDKRISLLHEEPTVWNAVIRFDADKIISIERSNVIFNDTLWERNRTKLLNWIDKNHAELNGFIYDQTETGGAKYLKAIELYKNKE